MSTSKSRLLWETEHIWYRLNIFLRNVISLISAEFSVALPESDCTVCEDAGTGAILLSGIVAKKANLYCHAQTEKAKASLHMFRLPFNQTIPDGANSERFSPLPLPPLFDHWNPPLPFVTEFPPAEVSAEFSSLDTFCSLSISLLNFQCKRSWRNYPQIFVDFVGNVYVIVLNLVYFNEYSLQPVSGTLRHNCFGKSLLC